MNLSKLFQEFSEQHFRLPDAKLGFATLLAAATAHPLELGELMEAAELHAVQLPGRVVDSANRGIGHAGDATPIGLCGPTWCDPPRPESHRDFPIRTVFACPASQGCPSAPYR
jgi:hypothetical protein